MVIRGDCGLERVVLPALLCETTLSVDVVVEELAESYEALRDNAGWDVAGLWTGLSVLISETLLEALSGNLKWLLVPVGSGLIKAGGILLRKSRYADGGVMGVFRASSFLRRPGEATMGLRSSDGKVPEPGVCNEEAVLEPDLLSNPAAAMVAVAVAEAMIRCPLTDEKNV